MLKIQELQIDGQTFYVREPRVRDYMTAKGAPEAEYVYVLMGGMILNADKKELGKEGVLELPLRAFDELNKVVETLTSTAKDPAAPLAPSDGSSTA